MSSGTTTFKGGASVGFISHVTIYSCASWLTDWVMVSQSASSMSSNIYQMSDGIYQMVQAFIKCLRHWSNVSDFNQRSQTFIKGVRHLLKVLDIYQRYQTLVKSFLQRILVLIFRLVEWPCRRSCRGSSPRCTSPRAGCRPGRQTPLACALRFHRTFKVGKSSCEYFSESSRVCSNKLCCHVHCVSAIPLHNR